MLASVLFQEAKLSLGDRFPFEDHRLMQSWDSLHRPIWMFDPVAFRGVYANTAALKLWGADSLEELLGRDFSNLSAAVRARTERLAMSTAEGQVVSERWTFYPNGLPVTVQAAISRYVLEDGRAVLLFEAAPTEVDAEERRAVEALRHTSTMITLFDQAGAALFSNPAAFSAYGSDEWPFDGRFIDRSVGQSLFAQALVGQATAEVCETLTRDGPRYHRMETRQVVDPVSGATGVLLNETDVTSRVVAERERVAAEQRAAMAETRQAFLTEMSHELRTPLNAVIGFSGLLKSGDLSGVQVDQAERVHSAGIHLLDVVNEMIRLSDEKGWDQQPSLETLAQTGPDFAEVPPLIFATAQQLPVRVLYVDDNESNRTLVKAILASQEIACETADNGREGLEAARLGHWNLILMDIQMPVMNGVEASVAIRSLPECAGKVPIIAVTANTLEEQLNDYRAAGMDDIVAKPIDMVELLTKVLGWSRPTHEAETGGAHARQRRAPIA